MIWNPDPIFLRLGPLTFRWYGLFFAIGIYLALKVTIELNNKRLINNLSIDSLFNYIFWATIIGARLGHCLFYDFNYYGHYPLKILFLWEGGLASHGALIGIFLAIYLYSKKYKIEFLKISDLLAAPASIAGACIRIGNFFNSEIIGYKTSLPWGIIFYKVDQISRHPTQLYESTCYLIFFFILMIVFNNKKYSLPTGKMTGLYLLVTFLIRFFVEFLKLPQSHFENSMTLNMGQLLSIPLICIGTFLYFRKPKHL